MGIWRQQRDKRCFIYPWRAADWNWVVPLSLSLAVNSRIQCTSNTPQPKVNCRSTLDKKEGRSKVVNTAANGSFWLVKLRSYLKGTSASGTSGARPAELNTHHTFSLRWHLAYSSRQASADQSTRYIESVASLALLRSHNRFGGGRLGTTIMLFPMILKQVKVADGDIHKSVLQIDNDG